MNAKETQSSLLNRILPPELRAPWSVIRGPQSAVRAHLFLWLSLVTALVVSRTASAAETTNANDAIAQTNSGPRIEFDEIIHDFGRLESGSVAHWNFSFTNTGTQTLEIKNVASSCGCTTLGETTKRVEPGKTGIIPIQFNSGGMSGAITKNLTLACNDSAQSNVVLYFKAVVWKPIDAYPQLATFVFGPDIQTNQTRTIHLLSNVEEPVSLAEPVCTNKSFRAELKTVKEGKEFEMLVTAIPPFGPGSWTTPITLKTTTSKMPVLSVNAYVMVQPALVLEPPQMMLPPPPLTNATSFEISVRSRATNALVLSEPSVDVDGAQVRLREVESGRLFQLIFDFPAGFQLPSARRIVASVKSNHPQMPIISIPIYQIQPPEETDNPPGSTNSNTPDGKPSPTGAAAGIAPSEATKQGGS